MVRVTGNFLNRKNFGRESEEFFYLLNYIGLADIKLSWFI